MSDEIPQNNLPKARVVSESRFSLVWIIPLVAALIGGWLIYKVSSERGEQIVISFESAEGIEAKKTQVRYKDVIVGKVLNVELGESLTDVRVTVEIKPSMSEHLGPETKFWVVRPRVSVQEISGLTTLLSGIYLAMDPGKEGDAQVEYKGLEEPPRVTSYSHGEIFTLEANKLGSLDVGSPVFYRQINVGEVIKYDLNTDMDTITVTIFIKNPYGKLVRRNTNFWNISGMDITLTSEGVSAHMESLTSLLVGGIAFETPQNLDQSLPVTKDTIFPLYKTEQASKDKNRGEKTFYVMYFDASLRGLSIGTSVEYRGIQVGTVEDIKLQFDDETGSIKIPVLVSLFAEQLSLDGDPDDANEIIKQLVKKGLRAQLKTSNLLTGTQYIGLVFPEDKNLPKAEILESSESGLAYAEFPTTQTLTKLLARSATEIMEEIHLGIKDARKLVNSKEVTSSTRDIAKILADVRSLLTQLKPEIVTSMKGLSGTLKNANAISGKLNKETVSIIHHLKKTLVRMDGTLADAQKTLRSANASLGEDSALQYELRQLIEEVNDAANSFSVLADTLQRKPNSLIFGK
jgi:paraquat-inducible protein B